MTEPTEEKKHRTPVFCSHPFKRVSFIDHVCGICGEIWRDPMPTVAIGYFEDSDRG